MNNETIIIEQTINAVPEKIWKALTDGDELKQWYFDIADFKPEVNYEFHFTAGSETKKYTHLCKITEVVPLKKLAYSWRYEDNPGNSLVTWELISEGNQTRVKLSHSGIETFNSQSPDFARESFVKGWRQIVTISLKEYAEKASSMKY